MSSRQDDFDPGAQRRPPVPGTGSSAQAYGRSRWGVEVAAGSLVIMTAALLADRLPTSASEARCLVVAFAVTVLAGCSRNPLAGLFLVPLAWMLVSGFLVTGPDTLVWCLAALSVAALTGWGAGRLIAAGPIP
ncbi:hypothetical protein [Kineosporia babensis]|uniref:Uncharacterized protein n=1 Tax=Kineosporia babensis TaxID=499548 RepID=A0A9X1NP22_9ACTN|nr:hypothetical protein [Kineosporia babensis]MCD5317014.1 hypothetical protein [Kineosporia babensis]